MILGFTGTQLGMTREQKARCRELFKGATALHHGDCIGADEDADKIARSIGVYPHGPMIVIHPPDIDSKRAFCLPSIQWEPKSYLDRNRDIVNCCDLLIAAPKGKMEQQRSGTWYTIRFAQKIGKPVKIILPNGKCYDED